jgi:hypothetical protein
MNVTRSRLTENRVQRLDQRADRTVGVALRVMRALITAAMRDGQKRGSRE